MIIRCSIIYLHLIVFSFCFLNFVLMSQPYCSSKIWQNSFVYIFSPNKNSISKLPSKHLLVFNTSWRRLGDISWRRLQHTSSVTMFRLPRRLEDVLKISRKTFWKTKNCYAEDVFKTSWRHVLKTSWRHVLKTSWRHALKISWRYILKTSWRHHGRKQNTYWGYLYLANLNVYLTNLYFTNLYVTNLRWIQNH